MGFFSRLFKRKENKNVIQENQKLPELPRSESLPELPKVIGKVDIVEGRQEMCNTQQHETVVINNVVENTVSPLPDGIIKTNHAMISCTENKEDSMNDDLNETVGVEDSLEVGITKNNDTYGFTGSERELREDVQGNVVSNTCLLALDNAVKQNINMDLIVDSIEDPIDDVSQETENIDIETSEPSKDFQPLIDSLVSLKEKKFVLSRLLYNLNQTKANKLYDKNGFDYTGYDKYGYDKYGFDLYGYNRKGFDKNGYNESGYDVFGYSEDGYDSKQMNILGYDMNGFNSLGYDKDGFDCNGMNKFNHHRSEYDEDGYLLETGFNDEGFNSLDLDKDGYHSDGFNVEGYNREGYTYDGFDHAGLDKEGYNRNGYNLLGYDRNGYNRSGYDENGFDCDGYDRSGYNLAGYDKNGYDRDGYDVEGFDVHGHNEEYNRFLNNKIEDVKAIKVGSILYSPIYGKMEVINREKTSAAFISSKLNGKPRRSLASIKVYLEQNPSKRIHTKYGSLQLFSMENKDFAYGPSFLKECKRYSLNENYIGKYLYFEMPTDWMRAEEYFDIDTYEEEVSHLKNVYSYIHDYYLKSLKQDIQKQVDDDHSKENPMHFTNMTNNHLHEYTAKEKYDRLSGEIERKPYNGSIVLNGEKVYIGNHAIKEKNIIDWADKRTQYYYQYNLFLSDPSIHIEQVRHYYSMYDRLFMYYDEYNEKLGLKAQDELLTKVLKAHRNEKQVSNIIESIQAQQYEIIKQDLNKNMIVLGCAGSGKTMILFHRLYYVLYNNPDFGIENVILLSPTNLLVNQTDILAKQLHVQEVSKYTVHEFIYYAYKCYIEKFNGLKDIIYEVNETNQVNYDVYNVEYLTSKVLEINNKTNSNDYMLSQEHEIEDALQNVENVLLDGNLESKDSRLKDIVERYKNSIKLCKKLSIDNLKALETSLEDNIALYEDVEIYTKIIEIFEPLHVFDENTHTGKSFFGRTRKFVTRMDRVNEYLKPLRRLTRKIDLNQMLEMRFNTPNECVQYCVSNSTSLSRMRISSIQNILEEITHIELDKVYDIYFYCLDCLEQKKTLEKALCTVKYLETTDRIGVRDYKIKKELFGKRLEDYEELNNVFELFDSMNLTNMEAYCVHDAFEIVELYQYLKSLKRKFNSFKRGHIESFLIDLIYKELKPMDSIYNLKKQCTYDELFAITYILNQLLGPLFTDQKLVLIDEFQDLSAVEIEFLNSLVPESIFNYYGDVLQCMSPKGIHTKEELYNLLPNVEQYELSVNYRNTYEITNYVNDALSFDTKMIATGVKGKAENIIMDINVISNKVMNNIKTNDRVAFIVKDKNKVSKDLLKHLNIIDIRENKTNNIPRGRMILYSVQEAKGLEFETVLVDDIDMNENEKYVAYTRALDSLYVISKEK